ncbi:MAG: EamA family transporter [Vicinamibacteria bacterium]|nr:EamA family transporter [Vicinamibacteria bacterium]
MALVLSYHPKTLRRTILAWIALFTIWIVWGSTYMAIRVVVLELPPLAAASLRFAAAGLVFGVAALVLDRRTAPPTLTQIRDYAAVGVLLLAGGNALVSLAERSVPSGIAALVVSTVALWVTLLDGLRPGGRQWSARVWLGALLGVAGVFVIACPSGLSSLQYSFGIGALVLASLLWSIGSVFAQTITRRLPLLTAATIEMLAGSAALFAESRLAGEDLAALAHGSRDVYLGWLYLVIFGSLVGFTAFAYALNELPASTVGTYAYVNPLVALILGAVFLGEPMSRALSASAGLIIAGVVLTTWPRRGRRPRIRVPIASDHDAEV